MGPCLGADSHPPCCVSLLYTKQWRWDVKVGRPVRVSNRTLPLPVRLAVLRQHKAHVQPSVHASCKDHRSADNTAFDGLLMKVMGSWHGL